MIIYMSLSLLVALIGGIMYYVSTHAETKEIGRLAFFAGLLAFLINFVRLVPLH